MNDEFFMDLALDEAWKYQFLTYPNPAVGCVILDKNKQILSIKAHEKAGSYHAELNAILQAFKHYHPKAKIPKNANAAHAFLLANHAGLFKGASAYVSLEPCAHQGKTPPCVQLFCALGFEKVFISVQDKSALAGGGAEILRQKGIKTQIGLCKQRGKELLEPFLKWQKGRFKLFKLALSLNGSPFGKFVSNEMSRAYAHKIRSKLDLLVIGGNTLRTDKPILDARLDKSKDAKAPNLCVLSSKPLESFTHIPAFGVAGREIYTQIPKHAQFIMFEGGQNFLKAFAKDMDMFLIFHNSAFNACENIQLDLALKPLYKGIFKEDSYGIYKRA